MSECRVEIYDPTTGEWATVEGITSVEIEHTPDPELDRPWPGAITTDVQVDLGPFVRALEAAGNALRAVAHARRDQFALAPPPVETRERPAWQSPYGPPQKGHRR